jgi:hypothetical protein
MFGFDIKKKKIKSEQIWTFFPNDDLFCDGLEAS